MAAQAVFEKRDGMTVIRMPEGRPFRILQLTDIHIGGGLLSRKKDRLALDAVGKIVRASHADLVVVTGDMVYPLFIWPLFFIPFSLLSSQISGAAPKCVSSQYFNTSPNKFIPLYCGVSLSV